MSRLLSLLLVLLFVFDVSLVAARPRQYLQHRSPTPVDIAGLNTNAKRFGRGLPPLPPLIKRKPTGIDSARRSLTSQCAKAGFVQVLDATTKAIKGYVSRDLKSDHYSLTDLSNAGLFSSTVYTSGQTNNINLLDVHDGNHFLAGLIKKNEQLGDGTQDDKVATLGRSFATDAGAPPQKDKNPSISGRYAETAIWTYDHSNNDGLTATWVNFPGQNPSSTPAYIYWLHSSDKFILTGSPNVPSNALAVIFKYISVGDQCL